METRSDQVEYLKLGTLQLEIHVDKKTAGEAAAQAAAQVLTDRDISGERTSVIFATGASQLETLNALTSIPGLPWHRVHGFHLDEYLGINENHPASFRRYLRERLVQRVRMEKFSEINGNADDPGLMCKQYAQELQSANPQLCLLGIGENGHLAFNDPDVADFYDPLDVRTVPLDLACRQQQVAEGWFKDLGEVPESAITVTIPALLRVPKLIVSVPGPRKAKILRRTLEEPVSTACPATILRTHPDATIYLDREAAAELDGLRATVLTK